jgi:ADP-ribose pyrophosphatase
MRRVIPDGAKLIPPEAKLVFKGIIYDVYHWQQKMFDGSEATFEMLRRPDTVKVIAVKDDKIVMLNEQQPGHTRAFELPGGRNDVESEDELTCAKRELLEETGLTFKAWRLLHVEKPLTKIDWFVYTFLATDLQNEVPPRTDPGEKITQRLVTFEECLQVSRRDEGKYLPTDLLTKAGSLDGLLNLPEYR